MVIERIFCINLDTRVDRWEEVTKEFDRLKLKVERFRGFAPVNQAYYECLKQASKYKSSLILEDDVEFRGDSIYGLDELPDGWDMCYLGANLSEVHKERVSEHLYRFYNGWAVHAVLYSQKMMKWLVKNFDPNNGIIYDEWVRLNVLRQFNCYVLYPLLAYQKPGFSDYRNRFMDYTRYFEKNVFQ